MANDQILKAQGLFEDPSRMVWINRHRRMCFSDSVIRDHEVVWLEERLLEKVPQSEFRFHSNRELLLKVCKEILEKLN